MLKNHFNLVSEPWIPVAGRGLVSLADIFSEAEIAALGGNPIQKIALTKLLLAIVQTAWIPQDDADWIKIGISGMAKKTKAYLMKNFDAFWLYGHNPFLQMSAISKADVQNYGAVQIDKSTGNTTILTQSQVPHPLTDAEKALLVVQLMGFALGGKKTDNSVVLSPNYTGKSNAKGKPSTGKPGPSIGFIGFLHSFLSGASLQETLWLNLLTDENMHDFKCFPEGFGIAPWDKMPKGEDCRTAKALKMSYMGRLIPMSRFVLLADAGLHYSEGIAHSGYADGMADPSVAIDFSSRKVKALWADPEKRPWRQLTSLLSFIVNEQGGFECRQLRMGIPRAQKTCRVFGIWSGGLKVKNTAGEQDIKGLNDFVESEIFLDSKALGKIWFFNLKRDLSDLEMLSKVAYGATIGFFKDLKTEGTSQGALVANLFWQLCERKFQALVNACESENSEKDRIYLRRIFAGFVNKAYNTYCPKDTARQLSAWAANRPNLAKYLA